jgi:type VI secretion system secreted protein VgrG
MADYTQETRHISLSTPLGDNVLLLTSFAGTEAISRPYVFTIEMLSAEGGIKPADIVGKNVTFTIQDNEGTKRCFNGYVSRFASGSMQIRGMRHYRAEVVPWLWFSTLTTDCRIFQNKNAVQIIEQIFSDLGYTDFQKKLSGSYVERDYCVQYRESDFNFVSRLMEEEGIFYYFVHENGKHTMILGDSKTAYANCEESEAIYSGGSPAGNCISSWEHAYEFRTGKWAQTDYNFETPSTSLMAKVSTLMKVPGVDKFEVYDYPGLYSKKAHGESLVKVRMEEEEARHDIVNATSTYKTSLQAASSSSRSTCLIPRKEKASRSLPFTTWPATPRTLPARKAPKPTPTRSPVSRTRWRFDRNALPPSPWSRGCRRRWW